MRFYTRKKRPLIINIISLIDILVLLLIFFVVTTTFKKENNKLGITLPESTSAQAVEKKEDPILIHATKNERILIGEEEIKLEKLSAALKSRKTTFPSAIFALKADKDVPLGFFVKVLDAANQAGIGNLSLLTEPSAPSASSHSQTHLVPKIP